MTVKRLFGTDGIRGRANQGALSPATIVTIAQAAGQAIAESVAGRSGLVLIGKDTRLSGYAVENALVAGFASIGMDVRLTGPIPTPAVAMMTRSLRADLGVMITASHNSFEDNGIKFFNSDGRKVGNFVERRIEELVSNPEGIRLSEPREMGRARRIDDAVGRYCEFVKGTFPRGMSLRGLRIAVDASNGAAYRVAPEVLFELGAEVIPLNVEPDGRNINAGCGAVHPEALARAVVDQRADFGLALDGDADRVIIVDETGTVVDGDQILGCIARSWKATGMLRGAGVAATVLSNLGLERWLGDHDLRLIRTQVGDRHVAAALRDNDLNLGGEQSGHVICGDLGTTGDGLVAALQVLSAVVRADRAASEVARVFEPVPQRMLNLPCRDRSVLERPEIAGATRQAEAVLAGEGRVLVRPSGTEPLVRIMAECDDANKMDVAIAIVAEEIARQQSNISLAA